MTELSGVAFGCWRTGPKRRNNRRLFASGDASVIKTVARLAAASIAFVLIAGPALAEESGQRDFCADRPGKGSPTCTLDPGVFQAEAGFAYEHFDQGGVEAETFDYGAL